MDAPNFFEVPRDIILLAKTLRPACFTTLIIMLSQMHSYPANKQPITVLGLITYTGWTVGQAMKVLAELESFGLIKLVGQVGVEPAFALCYEED